jgi:3-mercaptopyruvate sulfurtransferase SseA
MSEGLNTVISTGDLAGRLGRPGTVILDVREAAAYNGWRLNGEARGGHIRGAVSLPLRVMQELSEPDRRALLEQKRIRSDGTIAVYGVAEDDSAVVARWLRELGGGQVLVYSAGLATWAADETLPMDRLPRYERLVHPRWVHELVQGKRLEAYNAGHYVLAEVGWERRDEYVQGHVPGAVYLDTAEVEELPLWNRVADEDLEAVLLAHGIAHDTTVVLYGRDTSAAARVASLLMYAGVEDVRLLDGGFDAWVSAGYGAETGSRGLSAVGAFGREIPANRQYIIGLEEARAMVADDAAELVDVRSWAEYAGLTSGYDYLRPAGHIAGALFGPAGSAPHRMDHLRNADGTMRGYHEIAAFWRERSITPDRRVAFYCGTGWRASEAFFYAYLMGWESISVFDGGGHEWSADPANPIASGEPAVVEA